MSHPVLLVHGIGGSADHMRVMASALRARGLSQVRALSFYPNDGRAPIAELAAQVGGAVRALSHRHGGAKVDVVAHSMGALATRTYLQRGDGKTFLRRFVSISGPHQGTMLAYALRRAGVRDMRPNSDLLRMLDADAEPFGDVQVHVLYTPWDLMILPASSGLLRYATSARKLDVKLHRFMISDPIAVSAVFDLLTAA
jgi:triacylglycerol lipase